MNEAQRFKYLTGPPVEEEHNHYFQSCPDWLPFPFEPSYFQAQVNQAQNRLVIHSHQGAPALLVGFFGLFIDDFVGETKKLDGNRKSINFLVKGHFPRLLDKKLNGAEPNSQGEDKHPSDFDGSCKFAPDVEVLVDIALLACLFVLPLLFEVVLLLVVDGIVAAVVSKQVFPQTIFRLS